MSLEFEVERNEMKSKINELNEVDNDLKRIRDMERRTLKKETFKPSASGSIFIFNWNSNITHQVVGSREQDIENLSTRLISLIESGGKLITDIFRHGEG